MDIEINRHRKVAAEESNFYSLQSPFSFFELSENRFDFTESIRRVFSLARSFAAKTLVLEEIPADGMIAEENEDILSLFPDYTCEGLCRLSFFRSDISEENIDGVENDNLLGYAIFKKDVARDSGDKKGYDGWHVFESVFIKYPHRNNCTPNPQTYFLDICGQEFSVQGTLYCQQNSFNKACAQVALRSLLSKLLPEGDLSYRQINQLAAVGFPEFNPGAGLGVAQIRKIFETFEIKFADVDYCANGDSTPEEIAARRELEKALPYQKYAYSGLESGGGALVGFRLSESPDRHIIPIFGHTFNKDTWAPDANFAYFKIGADAGYIPSESWTSSFIAHDDNFGPNFCIPRLYIKNENVDYILEVFRPGIEYSGVLAEAFALQIAYSLLENLDEGTNAWIARLKKWLPRQRIVFRANALTRDEYIEHLRAITDWDGNKEVGEICDFLAQEIPEMLWVVEVSTPHLFPANKRKLGDIVFSGNGPETLADGSFNDEIFAFARLPGVYMLGGDVIENGSPQFIHVPSSIESHTCLFGC